MQFCNSRSLQNVASGRFVWFRTQPHVRLLIGLSWNHRPRFGLSIVSALGDGYLIEIESVDRVSVGLNDCKRAKLDVPNKVSE